MLSQFGIEASGAVKYAIAFAIILVLLALFGLVLRRVMGGRPLMSGQDRSRGRQPRLGVVDSYELDTKRQLVLLRRDNVEHLLLIGGLTDVVIETNIVRVAGARIPAASAEQGAERYEPAFEQTRPQVESLERPSIETQLAAQLGSFMKRPSDEQDEPSPEPHVVSPASPRAEPAFRLDAAPAVKVPSFESFRPETPVPPFSDVSAVPREIPEPPPIRTESRPSFIPPMFQSRPTPQPPSPPIGAPPPFPQQPAPPPPVHPVFPVQSEPVRAVENTPGERSGPDAAILSDMAKQLEEALKRPATLASPERDRAELASAAIEDNPDIEDDLLEPTMPESAAHDKPAMFNDENTVTRENVVEDESQQAADTAAPTDVAQPEPAPEPDRDVAASAAEKPKDKVPDPFSVEEIEAEFARLLGRPLDVGKKG